VLENLEHFVVISMCKIHFSK